MPGRSSTRSTTDGRWLIPNPAPPDDTPYLRWITTHVLADSSSTIGFVRVRRPAWSGAPPEARGFGINHLGGRRRGRRLRRRRLTRAAAGGRLPGRRSGRGLLGGSRTLAGRGGRFGGLPDKRCAVRIVLARPEGHCRVLLLHRCGRGLYRRRRRDRLGCRNN